MNGLCIAAILTTMVYYCTVKKRVNTRALSLGLALTFWGTFFYKKKTFCIVSLYLNLIKTPSQRLGLFRFTWNLVCCKPICVAFQYFWFKCMNYKNKYHVSILCTQFSILYSNWITNYIIDAITCFCSPSWTMISLAWQHGYGNSIYALSMVCVSWYISLNNFREHGLYLV